MPVGKELGNTITKRKGKTGKYCPFFTEHEGKNKPCGDYCALHCVGLGSCVFHALNLNFQNQIKLLEKLLEAKKGDDVECGKVQ